jgi:CRP-like cAMP-binding protein
MDDNEALILRLLFGVKIFAGFAPQDGKDLLMYAVRLDVVPGVQVVHEGDSGREFYIVLSGDFSVVKTLPSGKKKIIAKLRPGDSFGEMSFLDGSPRAASVVADSPGLLLKFEHSDLLRIPETAAKIYFNLAKLMANRIRDTNSLISLALEGDERKMAQGVPAEALMTHRNMRGTRT